MGHRALPTEVKILFTALAVFFGIFVWLFPTKFAPYRASFWLGGEDDWLRNAIFDEDGKPRKYFRHFALAWFGLIVAIVWILG